MSISKEQFRQMLKEKGLKVTNQRLLVLEVLAENRDRHMTAEDIYEMVKEDYPEIGLATIYRTVQLLLEMQLVDRISLDDGCVRYEIGEPGAGLETSCWPETPPKEGLPPANGIRRSRQRTDRQSSPVQIFSF